MCAITQSHWRREDKIKPQGCLHLAESFHHAYQNLAHGNRHMKDIVHITEAFGGGVLSMLVELSNRAAEAGANVSVIYSLRRETPKDFARLFHPKVKMTYVAMCREISFKKDWSSLRELVQNLRDRNPEVIHLHSSKAGALGRAAAKIASPHAKVLYSPHGPAFLRRDVSATKQFAYLSFERLANYIGGTIVACSRSELHEIKGRVHARAAIMIENGVDVREIPVQCNRSDGRVVIGMTGRASFQKNHEVFIQLANELRDPAVSFVWIGGNAEDVPAPYQGDAVTCSGWVTRARALDLMSQLDVYVQTSLWTYTRGVHSLRAKSVKAFCGGVAKDSPFRCMHTSKYIVSVIGCSGSEDLSYCTREADIEHCPTVFVHDLAMAAFV